MACVYILYSDEFPTHPRYVGVSKYDSPEKRLKLHIYESNRGTKRPVYNWMRKVENKVFASTLATKLSWSAACQLEVDTISEYRKAGHKLLNLTSGGEGNFNPDESVRAKISAAHKGKTIPDSMRKHLSDINTGKHHSEETKKKMSESHMGINTWAKGTKLSDERKADISKKLTGRPVSAETREKISNSNRGKKRTPEQRETMRKAQRLRHQKTKDTKHVKEDREI